MNEIFATQPLLVPRVWGGTSLRQTYGIPGDQPIGEAWLVADLPEGASAVIGASDLRACVEAHPELAGDDGRFPLLIKVIDALSDLSIQVHPGPGNAHLFEGARSKDECWLVLAAQPGASIYFGFRRPCRADEVERALEEATITDLLERVEVHPGDVFRIEPGTVHAIGAGVVLLEVQEPSDTTFRVFDYNRPGLDGKPRPLHVEQALAVSTFTPARRVQPRVFQDWELLVEAPGYAMLRGHVAGQRTLAPQPKAFVVVALDGPVELRLGGKSTHVEALNAAIVPPDVRVEVRGHAHVVVAATAAPKDL